MNNKTKILVIDGIMNALSISNILKNNNIECEIVNAEEIHVVQKNKFPNFSEINDFTNQDLKKCEINNHCWWQKYEKNKNKLSR